MRNNLQHGFHNLSRSFVEVLFHVVHSLIRGLKSDIKMDPTYWIENFKRTVNVYDSSLISDNTILVQK